MTFAIVNSSAEVLWG